LGVIGARRVAARPGKAGDQTKLDRVFADAGGPLVWRTSDGPVPVGVVSFGDGGARRLKYGVYTRVSAYRDWIDRAISADPN
jgi:trypsin